MQLAYQMPLDHHIGRDKRSRNSWTGCMHIIAIYVFVTLCGTNRVIVVPLYIQTCKFCLVVELTAEWCVGSGGNLVCVAGDTYIHTPSVPVEALGHDVSAVTHTTQESAPFRPSYNGPGVFVLSLFVFSGLVHYA